MVGSWKVNTDTGSGLHQKDLMLVLKVLFQVVCAHQIDCEYFALKDKII